MTVRSRKDAIEEVLMGIVGGLDVHRAQITFDWVDQTSGESGRGRVAPATRDMLRAWLGQLPGRDGAFAVEATTGWRFVVEELQRAGFEPHLAEPADTAAARGKKRRSGLRSVARNVRVPRVRLPRWGPGRSPAAVSILRSRQERRPAARVVDRPGSHPRAARARRCGCGTRWSNSAANGTSASTPSSTTTDFGAKPTADALRELLEQGRLPESWIAPAHILELRETVRLRHTLVEQRSQWHQRIHAILYHHGLPKPSGALTSTANRCWLATVPLPAASRQAITVGLGQVDQLTAAIVAIDTWLKAFARHQPGCRALMARHFGIGAITAATILAEVGDARRFRNGDAIVRYTGLDVTVYSSDGKRSPGHLARQGPPTLRWALFEAAMCAPRPGSPDYDYYHQVKERTGGKRPALSVARKLARRVRHTLVELGDDALAPVDPTNLPAATPQPSPAAA
jgi:transposase